MVGKGPVDRSYPGKLEDSRVARHFLVSSPNDVPKGSYRTPKRLN